jgi:hypothetical protein
VALIATAEIGTRCLYGDPIYPPFLITNSDYLPFTTPANCDLRHSRRDFDVTIRFDENGFRVPIAPPRQWETRRSLYLGDSFTLGWGLPYKQSYAGLLTSRYAPDRTILNAAYTASLAPDSYYAYLARNAKRLGIDEVKIFICNNDIHDMATTTWESIDEFGGPRIVHSTRCYINYLGEPLEPAKWKGAANLPLLRHSLFWRKLTTRLGGGIKMERPWDADFCKTLGQALSEFKRVTAATVAFCRASDLRLSYVIVAPRPKHRSAAWIKDILPQVRDTLTELGIDFVDTHASLPSEALYLPYDGHLNALGAQVVADLVWQQDSDAGVTHAAPPISRVGRTGR